MARCPHCGQTIQTPRRGTFESSTKMPFRHAAAATDILPAGWETERERPAFMPTVESNVKVPMFRAMVTGAVIGAPVSTVVFGTAYWAGMPGWQPVGVALVVGTTAGFVGAGVQWFRTTAAYDRLLWQVEWATGQDIDGDGQKGEPVTHKVEVKKEKSMTFIDLYTDNDRPEVVYKFIRAVVNNETSFSERGAAKVGYSAELFKALRDEFIRRGVAYWRHPTETRQGVELTVAGRALLRELAALPYPTE